MAIKNAKRVVIKVGTSTLTYENGKPNLRRIEKLSRIICDLKNSGIEVILVSSGAIAVGRSRLGLTDKPTSTRMKQAVSAVGQCDLMSFYDRFLSEYGYVAAQILLTRDVVEHEERKRNVTNTLESILEMGAVPIINENDSVSIEEIEFGDNDRLSAIVAVLSKADGLIILTDIDGLYDSDPRENPDARLIAEVAEITAEMLKGASGAGTSRGTGGMRTKLEAAAMSVENGIEVAIISGKRIERIYDLLNGSSIGTIFRVKVDVHNN